MTQETPRSSKIAREFLNNQVQKLPTSLNGRKNVLDGDELALFVAEHLHEFEDAEPDQNDVGPISPQTKASVQAAIDEFDRREEQKLKRLIPLQEKIRRKKLLKFRMTILVTMIPSLLIGILIGSLFPVYPSEVKAELVTEKQIQRSQEALEQRKLAESRPTVVLKSRMTGQNALK